jgi:plasmid stabilization system protein ParE
MATVLYTRTGRTSLRSAFAWLIMNDKDPEHENATRSIARIITDLEKTASNPMFGIKFRGHETRRYWLIANKTYRVYYDRSGPDTIKVVYVRSVRQRPISEATLERYFTLPSL